MTNTYSILINTCDSFDDCWDPFFKLWSIFWPDCNGKIYLNTEYKDYNYPEIDIHPIRGCKVNKFPKVKRASWSQCLKWALEKMEDDIILYMQEDYFLKDKVKNEWVEHYVQLMHENPKIKCLHLTDQSVRSSGKSEYHNLDSVELKQRYRVSCQAALWRKQELLDIIRIKENAWEFEEFGSQRSAVMRGEYLAVNRNFVRLNDFEIIPYIFTGIVQGHWLEETVPLFDKHRIIIDYSIRGFVKNAQPKPFIKRVKYRFNKIPKIIRNKVELNKLLKNNIRSSRI